MNKETKHRLRFRSLGIDTRHQYAVFMRADCHVCQSEGFEGLARVLIRFGVNRIIATVNIIRGELLQPGEGALSEEARKRLGIERGDEFSIEPLSPVESLKHVRAKMYGAVLGEREMKAIIADITVGNYSNVHLSAFIAACAGDRLSIDEIIALTRAMIDVGEILKWEGNVIADKHCVGGLPGNRTTPIVIPICAAAGLILPKTSSRAITSPAGTADVMEVLTPVDIGIDGMVRVVRNEGACIAWGGAVRLSPADDILIRVEKALDIDSAGQMIASVLSKKAAAGSSHVVIDIPVGPTAKVRSNGEAEQLRANFITVGKAVGLKVQVVFSDGSQPIGVGIGPALEARDVLAVLKGSPSAPKDLREKALDIAGVLLELTGQVEVGKGISAARSILDSGRAMEKFRAICEAQGGFKEPGRAPLNHDVCAMKSGFVKSVDNRKLARVAKLAGAPEAPTAGLAFRSPIGNAIDKGSVLFTIHAESIGQLEYALDYVRANPDIISITP